MMDVGTRKLLHQMSGRWLLEEQPTTARPGSFFRCSFDICDSYQTISAEGNFHFESDVSSTLFNAVAAQVEHDTRIGNMLVFVFHVFLRRRQLSTSCGVINASLRRQARPRRYAVRRSDGGHESCWACIWAWADVFHNQEGN